MKVDRRYTVFDELKDYDHIAKDDDFIEVTAWSNGEGFDVEIVANPGCRFQLTFGQFKALKKCVKELKKVDIID